MEHSTKSMRSNLISWKWFAITLETRISYKRICSHCAESSSKSGLSILTDLWTRLVNCDPDSGARMKETRPSGEVYSAISQQGWTLLGNYSSSGEILVLDSSPGKGCGWNNNTLPPPDLSSNLESLECVQLVGGKNISPRWNECPH